MRNPAKRRNISLVVATSGLATLGTTLLLHKHDAVLGAWFGVVLASFFVSLLSLVAVVVYQVHVRWIARLNRGAERLAQWTVSPTEWQQFRANDKVWRNSGRPNSFKPRKDANADVEVIVAKNALMVDNDFYSLGALRGLQWIPETPPSLEYNMVTQSKSGSIKWNIRLPVATNAEPQARAVWNYVHRAVPVDSAKRLRRLRLARTLGLVCAVLSAAALIYARVTYGNQSLQTSMLTALIFGVIGLPGTLLLSLLSHWQVQKVERTLAQAAK
ncbi:MAG: hypothetical protein ABJB74_11010 [Gemmatimonas sp.]